jgi:hypothetical protein
MAETQANKLRARTRDALGPKVKGLEGHRLPYRVHVVGGQAMQLTQPPLPLSTRSDSLSCMPLNAEEGYPL